MTENLSRRKIIKAGIMTFAAGKILHSPESFAKVPDGPRVTFLLGDYYHNGPMQEFEWRRVLGPTGWKLMFAQSSDFVTPDVLANTDLFVLCRYATNTQKTNYSLGWSGDKIIEKREKPVVYMTDAMENAIIENVKRGMGLLAIHCSIWNPEKKKFLTLLGAEKPIMHTIVQPAHIHNLNQNHPITQGIKEFDTGDDEIFNAVMLPGKYELLFNTSGEEQKIDAYGGWCREEGKGRIVALLPGHTCGPYQQKPFKEIMWRSAHWALKKNIPPAEHLDSLD